MVVSQFSLFFSFHFLSTPDRFELFLNFVDWPKIMCCWLGREQSQLKGVSLGYLYLYKFIYKLMKPTSWGIKFWRPEAVCTHCRFTQAFYFHCLSFVPVAATSREEAKTATQTTDVASAAVLRVLLLMSTSSSLIKISTLEEQNLLFSSAWESDTLYTWSPCILNRLKALTEKSYFRVWHASWLESFYIESNVWPGNEGTGGRRQ